MKILIEIECDLCSELHDHLHILKTQLRAYCRKNKISPNDDIPQGLELDDDNCYGSHELKVSAE